MIKLICSKVAQAFPPLPPIPWRPMLGAGASIGPIRPLVVCVAVVCAPNVTAPPNVVELIPRAEASTLKPPPSFHGSSPWHDARPDHLSPVAVPAPGALAVFALGVVALVMVRRR